METLLHHKDYDDYEYTMMTMRIRETPERTKKKDESTYDTHEHHIIANQFFREKDNIHTPVLIFSFRQSRKAH